MMRWFRHFAGIYSDPRLAVVARQTGQRRGDIVAVWCAVLETAASADEPGSVSDIDHDVVAYALDLTVEAVASIVEALRQRGLLVEDRVAGWERVQPEQPSTAMTSAERVRAYRQRRRQPREAAETAAEIHSQACNVTSVTGNVTPVTGNVTCNVTPVTPVTSHETPAAAPPDVAQAIDFATKTDPIYDIYYNNNTMNNYNNISSLSFIKNNNKKEKENMIEIWVEEGDRDKGGVGGKEKEGEEGGAAATSRLDVEGDEERYAFKGRVIKLTEADLKRWTKSFPRLQIPALLESRDAWLAEQPATNRRRWFMSTASWLAKLEAEAASKAPKRTGNYKLGEYRPGYDLPPKDHDQ